MDKVKIGIVGMGQRACHHGGALFATSKDSIHIGAICENRPDRLTYARRMYEQEFGYTIPAYSDYRRMYLEAGLDGVFIAGPNDLHADMTIAALEAGLHVLCEKPMEVTLERCDEMIATADRTGRVLAMAMQMHYRKRYHKVRELIEQGVIGRVAQVWCSEYRGPFHDMKDWVWEKQRSGGALVEKNCHHYDILDLWVQSPPTTVYASGNIVKHHMGSGKTSQIIDNAFIVNDYECGARAMVSICFLADPKLTHYREFGVHGTEGKIFFNWCDNETIHLQRGNEPPQAIVADGELRGGMYEDFVQCIRTGGRPLVTGQRARRSLLVPMAAERSIEERRAVHVEELTTAGAGKTYADGP